MKVAIIGAGASGLTAIKCCLDEELEPTCYERTDELGGLWNYKDEVRDGQASVMKSTVINTSKEIMCYSDFPIPAEYPVFMHNKYVLRYFHLYAQEFRLTKYIQFNTEIITLKKCRDFASTGKWLLNVKDKLTGECKELVYDAVLICTGHHANTHKPSFPGQDRFKGKIIHSHDYKNSLSYEDKRVVIVGIGNSGGDAAVELSRVASQVFLSTRRGSWILNRVAEKGMPVDMCYISRFFNALQTRFPGFIETMAKKQLNNKVDLELYSLKPKHGPFAQHPTVNDDLPNRIICGSVKVKSNIEEITETGIKFDDGTFEDDIDVLFLATGYTFGFPFLDKSVIEVENNKVELFKYMFPPDLEHHTLAVIGFIQPLGAIMPISELQCRLATRVFKGVTKLPSRSEMWSNIKGKAEAMSARYVHSPRHTIQVDYIPFLDELALLNGCKPNLVKLLLKDRALAMKCIFGPCTPYQFRLEGPGKWKGARKAIMTQWDRTLAPLKTKPIEASKKNEMLGFLWFYICFVGLFVLVLSWFKH
ncbi:flavin-containing monooxygenase 5-like [Mya arenaria]|uniref:flavin-containing monooxygenase 5-like n=1 Tax=Mya arenaria TaxID=6604 RepID=UPI0022DF7577|nr:flavin-containing monooxygenase 5-like [Mya arenaria]